MIPFEKLHRWYDRVTPTKRFFLFFYGFAVPFVVSANAIFFPNHVIAVIARVVFVITAAFGITRCLYMHSDPDFVPRTKRLFGGK